MPIRGFGTQLAGFTPGGGISRTFGFGSTIAGTGALVDVRMDPTAFIIQKEFNQLAEGVRSFREPLERAVKQVMSPSFQRNFDVGGRPAWPGLAERTIQQRADQGYGSGPILVRSGRLRATAGQFNIWTIQGGQVTGDARAFVKGFPSKTWYGAVHQRGVGLIYMDIPARPFIVVQPEDADNVRQVFAQYVQERITRLRLRGRSG